jgi:hypothetical protein
MTRILIGCTMFSIQSEDSSLQFVVGLQHTAGTQNFRDIHLSTLQPTHPHQMTFAMKVRPFAASPLGNLPVAPSYTSQTRSRLFIREGKRAIPNGSIREQDARDQENRLAIQSLKPRKSSRHFL